MSIIVNHFSINSFHSIDHEVSKDVPKCSALAGAKGIKGKDMPKQITVHYTYDIKFKVCIFNTTVYLIYPFVTGHYRKTIGIKLMFITFDNTCELI